MESASRRNEHRQPARRLSNFFTANIHSASASCGPRRLLQARRAHRQSAILVCSCAGGLRSQTYLLRRDNSYRIFGRDGHVVRPRVLLSFHRPTELHTAMLAMRAGAATRAARGAGGGPLTFMLRASECDGSSEQCARPAGRGECSPR